MMTLSEYKDIVVNHMSDRIFLEAEQSRLYSELRDLRNTLESCCATLKGLTAVMGKEWAKANYNPDHITNIKRHISYYEACLAFVEEKLEQKKR